MSNILKGYVIPREVGMIDASLRTIIGGTGKIVGSTLAAYTGYQVAAHDVVGNPEMMGMVFQKLSGGVGQTISDVQDLVSILIEHSEEISNILGEFFGGDEASRADANFTMRLTANAYGRSEIDIARAKNSMLNNPKATFISAGLAVAGVRFTLHTLLDFFFIQDKPTLGHRIRMGSVNFFRRGDRSRKVDIPKSGGDTFTRI